MLAGSSRIDITPPKGVLMGGYLARTKGAEDIHDPLYARALVLDDGECRVAIVSADLMGLDRWVVRLVRERIEREVGIPAAHVMVACSHTHSGPLVAKRRISEVPVSYQEALLDKLVSVVDAAAGELVPARVGAGRVKMYLGVNRRERTADNRVVLGKNPKGYASPYSHVLVVAREDGGPLAVLFTCGAHPAVLAPDNLLISGDYPGHAERVVEEDFGDTVVALFALGFAGDVNVNYEKRSFGEVESCGAALGRAVLEEIKDIELAGGLTVAARSVVVPLALEPPPPVAEAERILYEERQRMSGLLGRGEDEAEIHRRRAMVEWAADLVRLALQHRDEHTTDLEVQVIRIGDIALLGISAEVFAEYARELDDASPFQHTFPISNANGHIGYLPTAAAFDEGGYEVEDAPRLLGGLSFRPEVEETTRRTMQELLAQMAPGQANDPED